MTCNAMKKVLKQAYRCGKKSKSIQSDTSSVQWKKDSPVLQHVHTDHNLVETAARLPGNSPRLFGRHGISPQSRRSWLKYCNQFGASYTLQVNSKQCTPLVSQLHGAELVVTAASCNQSSLISGHRCLSVISINWSCLCQQRNWITTFNREWLARPERTPHIQKLLPL